MAEDLEKQTAFLLKSCYLIESVSNVLILFPYSNPIGLEEIVGLLLKVENFLFLF